MAREMLERIYGILNDKTKNVFILGQYREDFKYVVFIIEVIGEGDINIYRIEDDDVIYYVLTDNDRTIDFVSFLNEIGCLVSFLNDENSKIMIAEFLDDILKRVEELENKVKIKLGENKDSLS